VEFHRLVELHFPEPRTGTILVTTTTGGLDFTVRTFMGSDLGGPTTLTTYHQPAVAIAFVGQHVTVDVQATTFGAGTKLCATAAAWGLYSDAMLSGLSGVVPEGLGPATRIQDNNDPTIVADVVAVSGQGNGLLVGVGEVDSAVLGALAAGTEMLQLDDNQRLVTVPSLRQTRVRGTVQQNAFAAGGTATLIAAPAANQANVLTHVQIGPPSATTVVTLESPSGTVLWAANAVLNVPPPAFNCQLTGGTAGAWVVRSSAVSTFSANAQGYTERVA
jgi:hypothetical protein